MNRTNISISPCRTETYDKIMGKKNNFCKSIVISTYILEDRVSVNIMIECKHILLEPKWLGKANQLIENIVFLTVPPAL